MLKKISARIGALLPREKFARSISVLVGGTAGAQLLTVLASPLLTRLYSPADFGILAIYLSLLSIFSVVATLRYELAIPLPLSQRDAAQIVVICLGLVICFSFFTATLVFIYGEEAAVILGEPRLKSYLWLLPFSVFFSGLYSVFGYWATREKRFSEVARTRIGQAIISTLIQLAGFKWGGATLVLSQVASQSVGTLKLGKSYLKNWRLWRLTLKDAAAMAMRYKRFPLYSTWEGLFNAAGSQLPPLLFGALFSPVAAGLYSLANRVLSLPMSLIGSAVGQVFFSNAAEAHREGRLGILVAKFHAKLAHIGIAPALFLLLCGPDLFALVFGEKWRQAGDFARWMSPWLYLVFVSSPLSTLFAVMERQGHGLIFQFLLLLARLIAIYIGVLLGDTSAAVMLFSAASAICWAGFLFWIGHATKNKASDILKPTFYALVIALFCAFPLLIAIIFFSDHSNSWMYGLFFSGGLFGVRLVSLLRNTY